jgi:uncharacterized OsmC-like protein
MQFGVVSSKATGEVGVETEPKARKRGIRDVENRQGSADRGVAPPDMCHVGVGVCT